MVLRSGYTSMGIQSSFSQTLRVFFVMHVDLWVTNVAKSISEAPKVVQLIVVMWLK